MLKKLRKYSFILILTLIIASSGFSLELSFISQEEASLVASNWLIFINKIPFENKKGEYWIESIEKINHKGYTVGEVYHLFPKGHIVISAFKELPPVKSFSVTSDFDTSSLGFESIVMSDLRDTLELLLSYAEGENPGVEEAIAENQEGWRNSLRVNLEGVRLEEVDRGSLSPGTEVRKFLMVAFSGEIWDTKVTEDLLRTEWSQGFPYNSKCPKMSGQRTAAGCVAIAGAQALRYYQQPQNGIGKHSYYWYKGSKNLRAKYNDSYNWMRMYNTTAEYSQRDFDYGKKHVRAVGELVYEVGVGVEMSYSTSSSGSYTYDLETVFEEYLKYDQRMEKVDRIQNANKWFKVFQKEINKQRPVIFRIRGDGGHAVVVDGYMTGGASPGDEATKKVHINMGWGGSYNGYYQLDNILSFYNLNAQYVLRKIIPEFALVLRKPEPGHIVSKGEFLDIKWWSWNCSGKVILALYKGESKKLTITSGTEDDGLYSWKVPSSITKGADYRIKIIDKENSKCCYWGDIFEIQ